MILLPPLSLPPTPFAQGAVGTPRAGRCRGRPGASAPLAAGAAAAPRCAQRRSAAAVPTGGWRGAAGGAAGGAWWSPRDPTSMLTRIVRARSALKDTSSYTGADRSTRVSRGGALRRASVPRSRRKHLTHSLSRRSSETAARQMLETRKLDGRHLGALAPTGSGHRAVEAARPWPLSEAN